MLRVFLVERHGSRKIDLGNFKSNTPRVAAAVAERRHKFILSLQANDWSLEFSAEKGPYRATKTARDVRPAEQLQIEVAQ